MSQIDEKISVNCHLFRFWEGRCSFAVKFSPPVDRFWTCSHAGAGRMMPKEQRSKQAAHWRQLWSCLPPAHHLLCKHLCLFMHILYNVCQFLRLAPTQAFEFYGDLLFFFFFLKKSESRVWQQNALLQKNTQVQEHLRWHLGVGARIHMCLIESEEWRHSFVVFGNSNVRALNCKSWNYADAVSPQLTSVHRMFAAAFWRIFPDKALKVELSHT